MTVRNEHIQITHLLTQSLIQESERTQNNKSLAIIRNYTTYIYNYKFLEGFFLNLSSQTILLSKGID